MMLNLCLTVYIMNHPSLTAPNFMEKSIGLERVKYDCNYKHSLVLVLLVFTSSAYILFVSSLKRYQPKSDLCVKVNCDGTTYRCRCRCSSVALPTTCSIKWLEYY